MSQIVKTKNQKTDEIIAPEEEVLFTSLRATSWDEFYGQKNIKESLKIAIAAAKKAYKKNDLILIGGSTFVVAEVI